VKSSNTGVARARIARRTAKTWVIASQLGQSQLPVGKADNIRSDSPIDAIDNLPLGDREDPDPFTQTEIEKILSTPTRRTQEINMMGLAFWSGLRISELIALAWEDIDLKPGPSKCVEPG